MNFMYSSCIGFFSSLNDKTAHSKQLGWGEKVSHLEKKNILNVVNILYTFDAGK